MAVEEKKNGLALTPLRVCRALFRMRFQDDIYLTMHDFHALKTVSGLFPACDYTFLCRFSDKPPNDTERIKTGEVSIHCMEFDKIISKDYVIRFETRLFQILGANKIRPRAKDKVLIRVRLDKSIQILWKNKPLLVKEISTMFNG